VGCFASEDNRVTEQLFVDWLEYGMYDYVPPDEVGDNDRQNVVQNIDGNDIESEEDDDDFHDVIDDMQHLMLGGLVDWELESDVSSYNVAFALDLKSIESEIEGRDLKINKLRDQINEDSSLVNMLHEQEDINDDLKLQLNYVRRQLGQGGGVDHRTMERLLRQGKLWELQAQERWILYRYWVGRLRNVLLKKLRSEEAHFRRTVGRYSGTLLMDDADILRESLIVGMTTTGAAKNQNLLQAVKPKIGKCHVSSNLLN
jgi:hypothetical protein